MGLEDDLNFLAVKRGRFNKHVGKKDLSDCSCGYLGRNLQFKAGSQFQAQAAGCDEKRAALLSVDAKYFMSLSSHSFLVCVFARAD